MARGFFSRVIADARRPLGMSVGMNSRKHINSSSPVSPIRASVPAHDSISHEPVLSINNEPCQLSLSDHGTPNRVDEASSQPAPTHFVGRTSRSIDSHYSDPAPAASDGEAATVSKPVRLSALSRTARVNHEKREITGDEAANPVDLKQSTNRSLSGMEAHSRSASVDISRFSAFSDQRGNIPPSETSEGSGQTKDANKQDVAEIVAPNRHRGINTVEPAFSHGTGDGSGVDERIKAERSAGWQPNGKMVAEALRMDEFHAEKDGQPSPEQLLAESPAKQQAKMVVQNVNTEPRVHIGSVDVIVVSEPVRSTGQKRESGDNHFASRNYLRRL